MSPRSGVRIPGSTANLGPGFDALSLALAFGSSDNGISLADPLFDLNADLNGDGVVDGTDLIYLADEFGGVCP